MTKVFVLDTNVLIHDPDSLYSFSDNKVVLPLAVIEELDSLKKFTDERGRNARLISRRLDEMRSGGKLSEGVPTKQGGLVRVETSIKANIPQSLVKKTDNEILAVALGLKMEGDRVIFISKDINMRIKAEVLGLEVQDFEKSKVKFEELYSGWKEMAIGDELIDEFHEQKKLVLPETEFYAQEFIMLKSSSNESKTGLGRYCPKAKAVLKLAYDDYKPWGLHAINLQQRFALEALLNEDIKLVTLLGTAGTGKTILALAAALYSTFDMDIYRRILISRPIMPMGNDIGYLPGSKEEKLSNWMGAFYDNLEFLVHSSHKHIKKAPLEKGQTKSDNKLKIPEEVDNLFETGKIEIEALTYLRGRSIPDQYMIIDEAQNLTPLEVKTVVSRAGKNTKVVLTGDPYQIDNPYLDSASNGLTYLAERFKDQYLSAHITLEKSERSELAGLAAQIL